MKTSLAILLTANASALSLKSRSFMMSAHPSDSQELQTNVPNIEGWPMSYK